MATMPRNMVTLGEKSPQIISIGALNGADLASKTEQKRIFYAKIQNVTKRNYLLCSVKVGHLKKHTFYDLWPLKVMLNSDPERVPQKYK